MQSSVIYFVTHIILILAIQCSLLHHFGLFVWSASLLSGFLGFPGGSEGKASACNAGDPGLIPGSGRSPGEGNSNPLQYSCLGNSMDKRAWPATVHRTAESQT